MHAKIITKTNNKSIVYNNVCSICLSDVNNDNIILSCGHIFHYNCLNKIYDKSCPNCRKSFIIPISCNLELSKFLINNNIIFETDKVFIKSVDFDYISKKCLIELSCGMSIILI